MHWPKCVDHYFEAQGFLPSSSKNKLNPDEWLVVAQRAWNNNASGNGFKQVVRSEFGTPLGKGSKPVSIEGFIPDLPVGKRFVVTDVKNWIDVTNYDQLRAFHKYAVENSLAFNLIIGPRTKSISEPLLDIVRGADGGVIHYAPENQRFMPIPIKSTKS